MMVFQAVGIPVIANGGVKTYEDAITLLNRTGAAAVRPPTCPSTLVPGVPVAGCGAVHGPVHGPVHGAQYMAQYMEPGLQLLIR